MEASLKFCLPFAVFILMKVCPTILLSGGSNLVRRYTFNVSQIFCIFLNNFEIPWRMVMPIVSLIMLLIPCQKLTCLKQTYSIMMILLQGWREMIGKVFWKFNVKFTRYSSKYWKMCFIKVAKNCFFPTIFMWAFFIFSKNTIIAVTFTCPLSSEPLIQQVIHLVQVTPFHNPRPCSTF